MFTFKLKDEVGSIGRVPINSKSFNISNTSISQNRPTYINANRGRGTFNITKTDVQLTGNRKMVPNLEKMNKRKIVIKTV